MGRSCGNRCRKQEAHSVERAFFLCSLPAKTTQDTETIGAAIRSHWAIENSLHWGLDVVWDEDASRVRKEEDAQRQARLEGDITNLDETLTQRLADIKLRPAQLLAEVEILRAVLAIPPAPFKQNFNGANTHHAATAVVGHWPWPEKEAETLSDEKAAGKALRATLKAEGFPVPVSGTWK